MINCLAIILFVQDRMYQIIGVNKSCGRRETSYINCMIRLQMVGGNISLFSELCEKTREDAFETMLAHAWDLGANAVIGIRYDATELMSGITEVLCYGTAVVVETTKIPEDDD